MSIHTETQAPSVCAQLVRIDQYGGHIYFKNGFFRVLKASENW